MFAGIRGDYGAGQGTSSVQTSLFLELYHYYTLWWVCGNGEEDGSAEQLPFLPLPLARSWEVGTEMRRAFQDMKREGRERQRADCLIHGLPGAGSVSKNPPTRRRPLKIPLAFNIWLSQLHCSTKSA